MCNEIIACFFYWLLYTLVNIDGHLLGDGAEGIYELRKQTL